MNVVVICRYLTCEKGGTLDESVSLLILSP